MAEGKWAHGEFVRYIKNAAVIEVTNTRYICSQSFFNSIHQSAVSLAPGTPLRVYLYGHEIRQVEIQSRRTRSIQEIPVMETVGPMSQSAYLQDIGGGNIDTPEHMKHAYNECNSSEAFSALVFPMWVLSEIIDSGDNEILTKAELTYAGFRKVNFGSDAFFRALGIALIQKLLLKSNSREEYSAYVEQFQLPSLLNLAASQGSESAIRLLNSQIENLTLWNQLTVAVKERISEFHNSLPPDSDLANFVTPNDIKHSELSEILVIITGQALRINLRVFLPKPRTVMESGTDGSLPTIALIREEHCYFPLFTLGELVEEGYDVRKCEFKERS